MPFKMQQIALMPFQMCKKCRDALNFAEFSRQKLPFLTWSSYSAYTYFFSIIFPEELPRIAPESIWGPKFSGALKRAPDPTPLLASHSHHAPTLSFWSG